MPNRILREGILTSERIAALGWAEEVFYRRLMSIVDDFGRYHANPKLLRAACYPLQLDKVSDSDIGKWLTACVNAALVRVYPAQDGKSYLELLDFRQQVRAKESKFPQPLGESSSGAMQPQGACAADAQQMHSNREASAHLVGVGVGDGVEGVCDDSAPDGAGVRASDQETPQHCEAWRRFFETEKGVHIDPHSLHDRKKFWPLAQGWVDAQVTVGQMRAAIQRARAEATGSIAYLPSYVDKVLASMSVPRKQQGAPVNRQEALEQRNRSVADEWLTQQGETA